MTKIVATVRADYYQYYLTDSQGGQDWAEADATKDGVIAPLRTGIKINSGVQYGPVEVTLLFGDPGPPAEVPGYVAAESDLHLPSGVVLLVSWGGPDVAQYEFVPETLVRVRVAVAGRDTAVPGGVPEQHTIHIWPVEQPSPRWRTAELDNIGRSLTR